MSLKKLFSFFFNFFLISGVLLLILLV